jgi:protein phosphatase
MSGHSSKSNRSKRFKFGLYGFVSDRGLNPKRVTNEDSFLLLEDVPLFAVADGVGGQNAGEVASQVAIEILKHHFSKKKIPADKIQYLDQVICFANRHLYEMAVDDELLSGMATTLALILFERKRATLSHVGDSRVYRFTAGKLYRETTDHSLAEDTRYGEWLEGESVNKNIITRALGIESEVEPETKTIPIPPDTCFLLCTDGITRHIDDQKLAEVLRSEPDPQTVCDVLKELCYDRGARDNLTAIVVKLETSSRFAVRPAGESAETAPPAEPEPKGSVARIQVELLDQDQGPPGHDAHGGGTDGVIQDSRTFSSQLRRDEDLKPGPRARKSSMLTPLFLGLALMGGFLAGFYVQPRMSLSFLEGLMGRHLTPAQQAFEQGQRSFTAGRYTEALAAFSQAVAMSPGSAEYYHWLAKTQVAMKDYPVGAENFLKAASLGGSKENYLYAAAAYQATGAKEKAAAALAAFSSAGH